MRELLFFFIILSILVTSSCSQAPGKKEPERQEEAAGPATEAYPSVPDTLMQMLWDRCDYIDFIFYDLSFSISQDQKRDIQLSVEHVSATVPAIQPQCKARGRVFYQVEGRNVLEGDIFFSPGCQYFIFYRGGKKAYANAMTMEGIRFYERVFSMVNQ